MGLISNRNNNGCNKHHYEHCDIDNPDFRIRCKLDKIQITKEKNYQCQHHGCNKKRSEHGLEAGFDYIANVDREKFHEIFNALADHDKDVVVVDQNEKETEKITVEPVFEGLLQERKFLEPGQTMDLSEYTNHELKIQVNLE